ncbi:MAG: helix-turn-helix transcriptional regulator [Crenarchaeota archaeon]|nr:helix-turn-helix transcriptional regulator [Thermoproteota archaeon]
MRTAIESVLEYLLAKALAGKSDVVKALYEYFVEGKSPSTLAAKYGLSKHQVRGYVQRITEKTGSMIRARAIVRYVTPYVLKVKPIIKHLGNGVSRCLVCGEEMLTPVAEDHVRKYHSAILAEYIDAILELLARDFERRRRAARVASEGKA